LILKQSITSGWKVDHVCFTEEAYAMDGRRDIDESNGSKWIVASVLPFHVCLLVSN
jgi:hypothetical protein